MISSNLEFKKMSISWFDGWCSSSWREMGACGSESKDALIHGSGRHDTKIRSGDGDCGDDECGDDDDCRTTRDNKATIRLCAASPPTHSSKPSMMIKVGRFSILSRSSSFWKAILRGLTTRETIWASSFRENIMESLSIAAQTKFFISGMVVMS